MDVSVLRTGRRPRYRELAHKRMAPGRNLDDTFGGGCVAPAHGTIDGWWVGEVTEVQALALLETPLAE